MFLFWESNLDPFFPDSAVACALPVFIEMHCSYQQPGIEVDELGCKWTLVLTLLWCLHV